MRDFVNLRARAEAGNKLAGTVIRLERNPAAMYLAKDAGLDVVMLDCEHSNYGMETVHDLCQVANAIELPVLVRVPELSKACVSRTLDSGAAGVIVPMIETAEDARRAVKFSKYPPLGGRGYTTTGGHSFYNVKPMHVQFMKESNERVVTTLQIETLSALEAVDEIAAVEGVDMLLIGPNDLSVSLGIPGDLLNPIELEAIARVAAACRRHGKLFSMAAGKALEEKFARELNVFIQSSDVDMVLNGMKAVKACVQEITKAE